MFFDDGGNPWMKTENNVKVFHFGPGYLNSGGQSISLQVVMVVFVTINSILVV